MTTTEPISFNPPDLLDRVIRRALSEDTLGSAFGCELERTLRAWSDGCTAGLTLAALPELTCSASGGPPEAAASVAAAWQLVRIGAKLLDDAEDGEVERPSGVPTNLATALLFAAELALAEAEGPGDACITSQIDRALQRALLRAGAGQHADLTTCAGLDPQGWLEIAKAKSGGLAAWAAWAGAAVGGADQAALEYYRAYGLGLGVLVQLSDDFSDVWRAAGGRTDLARGRLCLPVCYARFAAGPEERRSLEQLLALAARGDESAEAQAQQMLIDLGAQGYVLAVARMQQRQASAALQRAVGPSPSAHPLLVLLDQVFPSLGSGGA